MKQSPILFKGPMVNAILAGQKVQTRRIVKLRNGDTIGSIDYGDGKREYIICDEDGDSVGFEFCCPYGAVGDHLLVKETWCPGYDHNPDDISGDHKVSIIYNADNSTRCVTAPSYELADDCSRNYSEDGFDNWHNKPSIFMPRWASRITLEISAVRIERLQDITEENAKAEGVEPICASELERIPVDILARLNSLDVPLYVCGFYKTWVSLYGHESWWDNPFVWVVEFKRI